MKIILSLCIIGAVLGSMHVQQSSARSKTVDGPQKIFSWGGVPKNANAITQAKRGKNNDKNDDAKAAATQTQERETDDASEGDLPISEEKYEPYELKVDTNKDKAGGGGGDDPSNAHEKVFGKYLYKVEPVDEKKNKNNKGGAVSVPVTEVATSSVLPGATTFVYVSAAGVEEMLEKQVRDMITQRIQQAAAQKGETPKVPKFEVQGYMETLSASIAPFLEKGENVRCVYVGIDRTEKEFAFMVNEIAKINSNSNAKNSAKVEWFAVPHEDRDQKLEVLRYLAVEGKQPIPRAAVVGGDADANVINPSALSLILTAPEFFPYREPSLADLIGTTFVSNQAARAILDPAVASESSPYLPAKVPPAAGAGASEEGVDAVDDIIGARSPSGLVSLNYDKDQLKGKVLGLYFSAHWCPPCKRFTPVLKEVYEGLKSEGREFEVIFCSADRSQGEYNQYLKDAEMPWLAMPYEDRTKFQLLQQKLGVQGYPTLVLVDGDHATVITDKGVMRVMRDVEGKDFPWLDKPVQELMDGQESFGKGPVLIAFNEASSPAEQLAVTNALTPLAESVKERESQKAPPSSPAEAAAAASSGQVSSFLTATENSPMSMILRKLCSLEDPKPPTTTAASKYTRGRGKGSSRGAATYVIVDLVNKKYAQLDTSSTAVSASDIEAFVAGYESGAVVQKDMADLSSLAAGAENEDP